MKRIVLFVALACSVAPGFAHKVRVDFDHGTQFGRFKTYRMMQTPRTPTPDPVFPNQLIHDRVAGFIEEQLSAKGLKRTTSGEDLQISFRIDVIEQPIVTTFSDGWGGGVGWNGYWGAGWGPGWGSGFTTSTVQMTYEGVLVVDVVDAHRGKVVFEGTSAQMVSSKPEKNSKKLAKAVTEVMARYPPQP